MKLRPHLANLHFVALSLILLAAPTTAGDRATAHETLAALAGDFVLTSTFWPEPGAPPEISELPARREPALDGRALRVDVGPDAGGFLGSGLMGFDDHDGRYWYVWTDTSAHGVATLRGDLDALGSGSFEGVTPTPYGPTPLRVEIRFDGAEEVHDYFVPGRSGGEVRMLELRYRRRAVD